MPLPNLSGKSFLSTSPTFDSYQSGADSYREKVKEKIQNSPRRNTNNSFDYSKSIDLSLNRDNSFRPISRHRSNNNNSTETIRLKSAVSDNNHLRLKSARSRQIVFYNNETNQEAENSDNTSDLKKELHRRNNTRNRNFNTSPLVSDEDFNLNTERNDLNSSRQPQQRNQRLETNDFFDDNKPSLTKAARESLLKAPLITPRKSLQQSNNKSNLFNNEKQNENSFNDEFNDVTQTQNNKRLINRNNNENNENEFISNQNRSIKMRSSRNFISSRTSFRDEDEETATPPPPPVPVPRKRDQTTKLNNIINPETNEFRLKRNTSATSNKRSGYMPSPRSDQIIPQYEQAPDKKIELNKQYIRFQNDSNVPIIKGREENMSKNTGLLNSRKSGLKFRNSNQNFPFDNSEQTNDNNNYFLNNNYNSRRN